MPLAEDEWFLPGRGSFAVQLVKNDRSILVMVNAGAVRSLAAPEAVG
jgi:hypothetical protein